MARPIWKGSISFGLVNIPVGLYPAENKRELAFHMLDGRDMSSIHNKRVNERTGEEVAFDDIVKGYEYESGRFVVLGDEDFRQADVKATQTIDILGFVKADGIDPEYFDRPYHLAPAKAGMKGYALLREALSRAGLVGVAKIVIRTRQHLAAVIPRGPMLVLELMRWPYELRDAGDLELPAEGLAEVGASEKELAMAEQLVDSMVDEWDPSGYADTYHDDLMALIARKVQAGELTAAEPAPEAPAAKEGAEVVDIMSLLKKSVDAAKGRAKEGAPASKGKRKAAG
jgi:DNA end-binding protein Ku